MSVLMGVTKNETKEGKYRKTERSKRKKEKENMYNLFFLDFINLYRGKLKQSITPDVLYHQRE